MKRQTKSLIATGAVASLGLATIPAIIYATGVSGDVQLNTEVSTSIAMKIASPNDTNPDCMEQSGVTYGVANRYATSNGAEGSKQVDTFDGTVGGADELNTNTSCATLTMNPNAFSSTYSDITIYTNSPNGYSLTVRSADNTSPNLVNTTDPTQYIPAAALTEVDGTIDDGQGGTTTAKVVPGGQNKWALKSDTGLLDTWTPVATTDTTVRAYDQETNNGSNTRVTYGISSGNNLVGKYAATLTYTATMFDDYNPNVPAIDITGAGGTGTVEGAALSGDALKGNKLTVPYKATRTLTITPDEGYYLTSFTCPDGFTCSTPTTGSADDPSADARVAQDISITNNSVNSGGSTITMPITLDNKYRISFSKTNISSPSEDYVDVAYGGQTTVTVTPASGYYLSAFSDCPSGWSCSGVSTGTSYTGNQTLTLTNNSSTNIGTITLAGTIADPWATASCSSVVHSTCTVAGVQYIRLKDGHLWTKSSQGSTTWDSTLSGVSCPSGTSKPTAAIFQTLVKAYGGTNYSSYGSPYGTRDNDADLYNATGWSGAFWSTTEYNSNYAWSLGIDSSTSNVYDYNKSHSVQVVCYR